MRGSSNIFAGFQDEIVKSRVDREREAYFMSITDWDVCCLAGRYVNGYCLYFKNPKIGNFNICYFVQFDDGQRFVLRKLEFPSIGCLTKGRNGPEVSKTPATIDLNVRELEGLGPYTIQESYYAQGPLKSANDYTRMRLETSFNTFLRSRNSAPDLASGKEALYLHHRFRQFAEEWLDKNLDNGPFVLVHGDFMPWNLIVNDVMEITSVLDWEWSRIVPRQFFLPPLWLTSQTPAQLAWPSAYGKMLKDFKLLQGILMGLELGSPYSARLHDEWKQASRDCGFLVANALENSSDVEWVAYRHICSTRHEGKHEMDEFIQAFIEEDPAREELIRKKVKENDGYEEELARLRQDDSPLS
ncbi:hypothetical protein G7Z17_g7114 [Cylindrodendrum hubeiense]|uniref:Aminoglycoside phosphotransferase domain-containing protein n=1 Tax=Cylindrodendrum hubeiense TaxID=595255 RepID=A0A9P5H481_9HYPO|nr:hypothetical protein G7Z17_g7114 [Cylindrodendrum hubeiense]